MIVATLTIHLHLPACSSLKEKRGRIKPLMARLGCGLNFRESWIAIGREWLFPGNLRVLSQLFGQRSVNSKGQVGRNGSDNSTFAAH
jgi:hypothetical protein